MTEGKFGPKVIKFNKEENYSGFQIHSWMISKYDLKGNELLIYALIHQFKDEWFCGSASKIADMLGIKERKTVSKILNDLTKRGLLKQEKVSTVWNSKIHKDVRVNFRRYKVAKPASKSYKHIPTVKANTSFDISYNMFKLGLTPVATLIYAKLCSCCQNGNSVYYGSEEYLSQSCNCSIRSTQRALKSLTSNNLIKQEGGAIYVPALADKNQYSGGIKGFISDIYCKLHIISESELESFILKNTKNLSFDKNTHIYLKSPAKRKLSIDLLFSYYTYTDLFRKIKNKIELNRLFTQNRHQEEWIIQNKFFSSITNNKNNAEVYFANFMNDLTLQNINYKNVWFSVGSFEQDFRKKIILFGSTKKSSIEVMKTCRKTLEVMRTIFDDLIDSSFILSIFNKFNLLKIFEKIFNYMYFGCYGIHEYPIKYLKSVVLNELLFQ